MAKEVDPRNIEAETAVLGAVLVNNALWPTAHAIISATDFYREAHQTLWMSMERVRSTGAAIDLITLSADLERLGKLDDIGGKPYIFKLLDGVPKSTNIEHYARIVREKARLRAIAATAERARREATEASELNSSAIVEQMMKELLVCSAPDSDGVVDIGPAVSAYVTSLDDPNAHIRIPTSFVDLDQMLDGGMRPKDMVIIAARPGVGKTSLAENIGTNVARDGSGVVMFSLEMDREALVGRLISSEARVPHSRLRGGRLTTEESLRLADAMESTSAMPFTIIDNANTLPQIFSWCHQLKQRPEGLSVVIIDYVQLIYISGKRFESREKELAYISSELRRIARELDVVMVVISQLSRAPEGRKDKRPQLADLRETGALEQDAAVVMLIYRPEMHEPTEENRGIAEIIFAKQRNGDLGVKRLYFHKETSTFRNLAI